ncbi:MAG: energy transducer TonB [Pirellulales bacterium]|nr:energy transducer TonB [Pirellulales bacterium]
MMFHNLISRLGQPTAAQSIVVSIAVHVAVVSAMYSWPTRKTDRFVLQGSREVIQMTASPPQPSESVFLKQQPDPLEIDDDHRIPVSIHPRQPSPMPSTRHAQSESRMSAELPVPKSIADSPDRLPPPPQQRRQLFEPVEPKVDEVPPALRPKRKLTSQPPQPATVLLEQFVGLEDKSAPDLSQNPPPKYPAQAVRQRLEGTVMLALHISPSGRIDRVEVVSTSGHGILDRAAVEAVQKWHGQPAMQSGKPVATVERLPIRFRL